MRFFTFQHGHRFLPMPRWACDDLKLADAALSNGLQIAREHNDLLVLADLQRLRGRLLLKQDRRGEAQCAIIEAIETARRQGAGLYYLRSARDLARLLGEGDRRQAIELLAPAVESLTEHRAGLDYQESVELLLALRTGRPV